MEKKIFLILFVVNIITAVNVCFAATQEARLACLKRIALYEPSDDLRVEEVIPTPLDVKKKYDLTDDQLLQDILALSRTYSPTETNQDNRLCRMASVGWIGVYGTTNNLSYLSGIVTNVMDCAQEAAIGASINLLRHSSELIPLIKNIATNNVVFSKGARQWTYLLSYNLCANRDNDDYIDDSAQRSRIVDFFVEMAAREREFTIGVDRFACELNPSYRHSQQRRDNLARLRKPGLTGLPAQIYDAAQRDAQPKEDE